MHLPFSILSSFAFPEIFLSLQKFGLFIDISLKLDWVLGLAFDWDWVVGRSSVEQREVYCRRSFEFPVGIFEFLHFFNNDLSPH